MKYLIITIFLILLATLGFSQGNPNYFKSRRVEVLENFTPPQDTVLAPLAKGETRTRIVAGDTATYICVSLTAPRKWMASSKVMVIMNIGNGWGVLSPASTYDSLKFRTIKIINGGGTITTNDSLLLIDISPVVTNISTGTASALSQARENLVYFNPSSLISSYTLTLPTSAIAGDKITIRAGSASFGATSGTTIVTTFTVTHASTIIANNITTLVSGTAISFSYNGTNWYR